MTEHRAEQLANVVMAVAAAGAAVYVARTPDLRRLAWRLAKTALTATVPMWIGREVKNAWSESDHRGL